MSVHSCTDPFQVEIERFLAPQKAPLCPLPILTTLSRANCHSDFCHCQLVLLLEYHGSGIIQCIVIYFCLLLCNIISVKFITFFAYINSLLFFYCHVALHSVNFPQLICALYCWWTIGLLPLFVMNKSALNITVDLFWWTDALTLLSVFLGNRVGIF